MSKDNKYMNEYMKARYHRRRNEAIEKLGGVCAQCGSTENLELDHIDPLTKEYGYGKILAGGAEELVQAELAKAQVLCKTCHQNKTLRDNNQSRANRICVDCGASVHRGSIRCRKCSAIYRWSRKENNPS